MTPLKRLGDFRLLPAELIDQLAAQPTGVLEFLYGEEVAARDRFGAGEAWHGIHFLLNHSAWEGDPPLDFIVRGGRPLGPDGSCGPARGFSPRELAAICAALEPFIPGVLRKRFKPEALLEAAVYPNQWVGGEGEWLIDSFAQLKRFLAGGAERGQGLVVSIR